MAMHTDYAVSPGSYLEEWLEDENITQQQLADRISVSRKTVNQIVGGGKLSADHAQRLGHVTPISAEQWMRIEAQYEADLERVKQEHALALHADELGKNVRTFMKTHGYGKADGRNPGAMVSEFLTFHGVGTWKAFEELVLTPVRGGHGFAFRTETRSSTLDEIALVTWLQACARSPEMDGLADLTYAEQGLRESLPVLKERAAHSDEQTFDDLAGILRECGVVLSRHVAPANLPLHGVTRWIDGVPVIHQTCRQKRDGFIVFTLFHELGHVLNDPPSDVFLDDVMVGATTESEKRANAFAWDQLLPGTARSDLRSLTTDDEIRHAAEQLGVAPGVIVFYLHRTRALDRRLANDLPVAI